MPTVRFSPSVVALVAVGGALGSALRHLAVHSASGVPWEMLAVNVVGAVLAGFLVAGLDDHAHRARVLLPLAVVGVAGALTTFSGLVVDTVLLADAGRWGDAAQYGLASVVLGPIAAMCGMWLGGRR